MPKLDGGPAFPLVAEKVENHPRYYNSAGMTLRDYLAAHAPKRPQRWFVPRMPERPAEIYDHEHPSENCWDCMPRNWRERQEWNDVYATERLIQWPYAWADAQIAEREK